MDRELSALSAPVNTIAILRTKLEKRCREYISVNFVRRSGFEAPGKPLQVYACVHFLLVRIPIPIVTRKVYEWGEEG